MELAINKFLALRNETDTRQMIEDDNPATLTYHAQRPDRFRITFLTNEPPECITLRLGTLTHVIQVEVYRVLIKFEHAFDVERLHRLATCADDSSAATDTNINTHNLYISGNSARHLLMNVRSAISMERELAVIKERLMTGTFEDNEASRLCCNIVSTVRLNYAIDTQRLLAFCGMHTTTHEPNDNVYEIGCMFKDIVNMVRLAQSQRASELIIDGDGEFTDLSTDGCIAGCAHNGPEVNIVIDAGEQPPRLIVSVNADRTLFGRMHCAIMLIMTECRQG